MYERQDEEDMCVELARLLDVGLTLQQELSDSEDMLKGAVKNMRRKNAGKDAIGELKDEIKCFKDVSKTTQYEMKQIWGHSTRNFIP